MKKKKPRTQEEQDELYLKTWDYDPDEKEARTFAKKYQESGGYIHCDKEIFDKLYFLEEKEEIPKEIYQKVAEVFWFIKDLNNKRNKYAFDMIYKFFSKTSKM